MAEAWIIAVVVWIACGILGGVIGSRRNSGETGAVLGVLFGPLGVIASFALDGRWGCPKCRNKIDTGARVCPTCHAELAWLGGVVGTTEEVAQWQAARVHEKQIRQQAQIDLEKKAAQRKEELSRTIRAALKVALSLLLWMCRTVFRVVARPVRTADALLWEMSGGSRVAHRALRFGWFVCVPLTAIAGICVAIWFSPSSSRTLQAVDQAEAEAAAPAQAAPEIERSDKEPGAPEVRDEAARRLRMEEIPQPPDLQKQDHDAVVGPGENALQEKPRPVEAATLPDVAPEERKKPEALPVDRKPLVAIQDAEPDLKAAEVRERAARREKIKTLERKLQDLAKERRRAQQKAEEVAGQVNKIFGANPEHYLSEANKLMSQIKAVRAEVDELKREDVASRKP